MLSCGFKKFSPWQVTLTFLWPHLFQVTFDLTQVLDFGLQGFNLDGAGTNTQLHTLTAEWGFIGQVYAAAVPHVRCVVCGLSMLEGTCRVLHHTSLCHS